ncbi:hypothetical protein H6P81_021154 [Aristolochia fimbriata]|uniref:Uncharacterized protein n=1 Tax=Aristolochia fimbriata TaxID=158543 RepID=A0AAV7DT86_ARIFI|nr:hypothetical protein H6P81_021154 [Aristolochia fimbriata]
MARIIPEFHRRLIRRRDERADKLVSSGGKAPGLPVEEHYVCSVHEPFHRMSFKRLKSWDVLFSPAMRQPRLPRRWSWGSVPIWSSSPVKAREPLVGPSPLHKMIWELFAISLWDKASLVGCWVRDSVSAEKRIWQFSGELGEWSSRYILPLFSYFFFLRTLFACCEEATEASEPSFRGVPSQVIRDPSSYVIPPEATPEMQAAAALSGILTFSAAECFLKQSN